jgi:hypothetical protein
MNAIRRISKEGDKAFFTLEWGLGAGQRMATGVFVYTQPKNPIEKAHNLQVEKLIAVKKSELLLEQQ